MDHDIWNANRLFPSNEPFHSSALIPLASPPPTVTTFAEDQSPPPSPPPSTMPSKASPFSATSYAAAIVNAGGPRIDTASPPLSPNSSANLRSTSEALVKKLLQLDSPRLDPKIVDVLLLDGIMEIVISHLTRLDEQAVSPSPISTTTPPPSPPLQSPAQKPFAEMTQLEKMRAAIRERDFSDALAMKRSYHAMEILCGTAPANVKILQEKFYVIVTTLFDVFLPNSNGNLNHFGKIFETLLRRHPGPVLDMMVVERRATRLIDQMLPYICESPVQVAMLALLFFPTVQHDMKIKRQECYSRLQEMGFLEKVLGFLELKEFPTFVTSASEFLIRMIEEASRTEDSDILFKSLEMPQGAEIVRGIVELAINGTSRQREAAISVLNGFLVKSNAPPFRSVLGSSIYSDLPTPVSPLYSVSTSVQELLHPHLQRLCEVLVVERGAVAGESISSEMRFSAYTIKYPFITSMIALLEVIHETIKDADQNPEILSKIPTGFWKLVVNCFFELRFNNTYHALFYKMFCSVLKSNDAPTLKALITKQKLIARMIEHFEDKKLPTGCCGYILLILNQIRLTGDSQPPSEYIHQMLATHIRWKEFLPILRENTLLQTTAVDRWTVGGCKRPSPHFGPNPPIRTPDETGVVSTYGAALRMMNGIAGIDNGNDHSNHNEFTPTEENGIDLGSKYAFCLGFDKKPVIADASQSETKAPCSTLSRENSLSSSTVGDAQLSDTPACESPTTLSPSSSTSSPTSNGKNKRKKKKKKKAKLAKADSSPNEHVGDDDGDGKTNGSATSNNDFDDAEDDGEDDTMEEGVVPDK